MILAARALASGGRRVSPLVVEWDVSGRCEAPVDREMQAGPYREMTVREFDPRMFLSGRRPKWLSKPKLLPRWSTGFTVRMTVKCRKCGRCKMEQRREWTSRAVVEMQRHRRTWFGTLTFAPHVHNRFLNECRARESRAGVNFDALSEAERIMLLHRRAQVEITKYLKRVRKLSKAKLRYILVMETVPSHQNGFPHYHMLVHEGFDGMPVSYRQLTDQWHLGFSKWKLASGSEAARYVCKYVTKDAGARVRASVRYGDTSYDIGAISAVGDALQAGLAASSCQSRIVTEQGTGAV